MFPMTITLHNTEQLNAVLGALSAPLASAPQTTTLEKPVVKPPKGVKAHEAEGVNRLVNPVVPAEEPEETATEEGVRDYTLDDAKRLTTEVVKAGKRTEMVALLAEFKVQQASKLTADQVAPFCIRAEALLS